MEYSVLDISRIICDRLNIRRPSNKFNTSCWLHEDKKPSMNINLDLGLYHCFSCGASGTLNSLYHERTGNWIKKELNSGNDTFVFNLPKSEIIDYEITPEPEFIFHGKYIQLHEQPDGLKWLQSRGLSEDISKKYKMRFSYSCFSKKKATITNEGKTNLSYRALIPLYENSKLLSIEARDIFGEEAWKKSITDHGLKVDEHYYRKVIYPKFSTTSFLFDSGDLDYEKPLYVFEGVIKCIAARTSQRLQNSTATMGVGIKERQFYLLNKFKKIIFVPDNDGPAFAALLKLRGKDELNKKVYILPLPKTLKDMDDVLKGSDSRFKTVDDLIAANWLRKTTLLSKCPIEKYIDDFRST